MYLVMPFGLARVRMYVWCIVTIFLLIAFFLLIFVLKTHTLIYPYNIIKKCINLFLCCRKFSKLFNLISTIVITLSGEGLKLIDKISYVCLCILECDNLIGFVCQLKLLHKTFEGLILPRKQ